MPPGGGDRKSLKATGDTPTVATQKGPPKVELPPFQAFDVSSGDTVRTDFRDITSVVPPCFPSSY